MSEEKSRRRHISFGRWDISLVVIAGIIGGFYYGSLNGAIFTAAYAFLASIASLFGLIPIYGVFIYYYQFQPWLNATVPAVFGLPLSGLTWFIFIIGLVDTIIVTALMTVAVGIIVLAVIAAVIEAIFD